MPSPLYTYILHIYDMKTHFADKVFKEPKLIFYVHC